jgi:hypothetical protein
MFWKREQSAVQQRGPAQGCGANALSLHHEKPLCIYRFFVVVFGRFFWEFRGKNRLFIRISPSPGRCGFCDTDEWDWDVAKEVWQEEARDEGRTEAAVHYEARIAELEAQLAVP